MKRLAFASIYVCVILNINIFWQTVVFDVIWFFCPDYFHCVCVERKENETKDLILSQEGIRIFDLYNRS